MVAASFPFDPRRLLELRSLTACKIKLFVATEEEIEDALKTYYPGGAAPKKARAAEADSEISGTGKALEGDYDPTLSGEDSGLYVPVDGDGSKIPEPPSDVGLAELEDAGRTAEDYSEHGLGDPSDLDEQTLGDSGSSLEDESSETSATDDADEESDLSDSEKARPAIDTGPEDLDPFD